MFSIVNYQEQVAQIAVDVFGSMLGLEVAACEETAVPARDVAALVRIRGAWNGALVIQSSLNQAFEFTSRLMRIDKPDTFNEDVADALGELANMIGGNLKALLPPRNILSVPEIFSEASLSTRSMTDCSRVVITLQGQIGTLSVILLEHSPAPNQDTLPTQELVHG